MRKMKVSNNYFPLYFELSKVPRFRLPKNLHKDRMLLPLSIRCNTCGNCMYQGTMFYCKREQQQEEEDVNVIAFYVKCTICSAQITIKTHRHKKKKSGYVVHSGATRFFEQGEEIGHDDDASMKKSLEN